MIRIHWWLVVGWLSHVKPSFSIPEVVQQFPLLLLLAPLMKEFDLNWSNGTTLGGAVWRCSELKHCGCTQGKDRNKPTRPI